MLHKHNNLSLINSRNQSAGWLVGVARQLRVTAGLLLAAALLPACQGDEAVEAPAEGSCAVTFSATAMEPATGTRAVNAISTATDLQSFGVFGSHTGLHRYVDSDIRPGFMYNEKVYWDGTSSQWTYSPLKYWPNGEGDSGSLPQYVSFFAYAPYSDGDEATPSGYCIPTFSLQGETGNPWLTYRLHTDPAKQVDLLYCAPLLDQTKPEDNISPVPFTFQHALACAGDKVTVSASEELMSYLYKKVTDEEATSVSMLLTSVKITYTLTEKGRLVLWSSDDTPNWQAIASGSTTCERTVSLTGDGLPATLYSYNGTTATAKTWEDTNHGVFYIPIEVAGNTQKATITVAYDIVADGTATHHTTTSEVTLKNNTAAYKPGQHLYLNISIKKP